MKKRTIQLAIIILPLFVVMVSCNSISNLKTTAEYDQNANFKSFQDYKFLMEASVSDTYDNHSTENKRAFENAIHKELKSKGLEETETPDLFVNFFVVDEHKSESVTQTSYRDQHYGGMTHLDTYIKDYEQGTIIVDLVDASSKKLVWRGVGTGIITGKQKDMEKTINEAVKAVLSQYPPKA
ncbi:MAG: DUF4136 domain-containing protein [Flavobacteriaceae bacterium]